MSEGDKTGVSGSQASDVKTSYTAPFVGEVTAVRRSINALKWRHKQLYDDLLVRIDGIDWNTRRYKEVMSSIAVHRDRFHKLDERYLQLYQLLEGDKTAEQGYQKEWNSREQNSGRTFGQRVR